MMLLMPPSANYYRVLEFQGGPLHGQFMNVKTRHEIFLNDKEQRYKFGKHIYRPVNGRGSILKLEYVETK